MFSCDAFFKYFIYNSSSPYLDKDDQLLNLTESQKKTIKIAATIFSCLSFTLIPRLCRYMWEKDVKKLLTPFLKSSISTQALICRTVPKEEEKKAKRVACDRIINQLFLGNSEAFVNTTHFTFTHPDEQGRSMKVTTANHLGISHVITLCPKDAIQGDFPEFFDATKETATEGVVKSFANHQISWLNVGRTALDDPEAWLPIVHDCTEPGSEDAVVELSVAGKTKTKQEFAAFWERKKRIINQKPVAEWFGPVFNTIDKAVFGSERVLVHCQAGVSRSASIVAAYLISRFDLEPEAALNFLHLKRPCVNSKFKMQLDDYHNLLKQGRSPASS